MLNRHFSLVIAALLPLLLFTWFAPSPVGQIDFWLLWLIAMLGVGLPLLYAEVGLAHRSGQMPILGMQILTREADTSTVWRSFSWLSVVVALTVAALGLDIVSAGVLQATSSLGLSVDIPIFAVAAGMVVIATMLSLLGRITALAGLVLLVVALIAAMLSGFVPVSFMMTEISLAEWASAVTLALVCVGVGTGLYWFNNQVIEPVPLVQVGSIRANESAKAKLKATKAVFPIWVTQVVVGAVAFVLTEAVLSPIAYLIYTLAILAVSGYLIYYASSQLAVKFGTWIALVIAMIATLVLVLIGSVKILTIVLVILSLLAGLTLAIFSGWKMKISHMRKSLNFKSEGFYNLWRVLIRLVAPLMIVVAMVGWALRWLN